MNPKEEVTDSQNTPLMDYSNLSNQQNMSGVKPQYPYPGTMTPPPFMQMNTNMQYNPKMMQEYPNQQMMQNYSSVSSNSQQQQQQPQQQFQDFRQEMPKFNQNPMMDVEFMQNMMRMYGNRGMFNPMMFQPMTPTANPMDFFNFANSMMMASQFMNQMPNPMMNFDISNQNINPNFSEMFNKNLNNPQNYYSMPGVINPGVVDPKLKGSQVLDQKDVNYFSGPQQQFHSRNPSTITAVSDIAEKNLNRSEISTVETLQSQAEKVGQSPYRYKRGAQDEKKENQPPTKNDFEPSRVYESPETKKPEYLGRQPKPLDDAAMQDDQFNKPLTSRRNGDSPRRIHGSDDAALSRRGGQSTPERESVRQNQRRGRKYDYDTLADDRPIRNSAFDEQPIRSSRMDERSFKASEFEDRPIKSSGRYNYAEIFQSEGESHMDQEPKDDFKQASHEKKEVVQRPKHVFEDIPISGKASKRFEELLEEQLQNDPSASRGRSSPNRSRDDETGEKKSFLRKKSMKFLSSAANRSQVNKKTTPTNKGADVLPSPQASSSQANQFSQPYAVKGESKSVDKSAAVSQTKLRSESSEYEENEQKIAESKPNRKPPKKFLAKGEGRGGGKGINTSQESYSKGVQKTEPEQFSQLKLDDRRISKQSKSVEPNTEKRNSYDSSNKEQLDSSNKESPRETKGSSPQATERTERRGTDEDEIIKDKIEALNSEIAKFKLENERVKKIRQKHEDMLRNLNKEIEDFEKRKIQQERELEHWKEEEMKKFKREKRMAEKNKSNKEKEEVESLKLEIAHMQEDFKTKEHKYRMMIERLKKQVEDLSFRNNELTQELKVYEAAAKGAISNQVGQAVGNRPTTAGSKDNSMANIIEEEEEHDDDADRQNSHQKKQAQSAAKEKGGKSTPSSAEKNYLPKFGTSTHQAENTKPKTTPNPDEANDEKNPKLRLMKRVLAEDDYKYESNPYYQNYLEQITNNSNKVTSQTASNDGKIQRIYEDGKKEVIFQNGVKREIFPDGYTIVHFTNKDIKQTFPDGTVVYFFAEANTTQTTLTNGTNIFRFANNQVEFHNADSTREIHFADGTKKFINLNSEEITLFGDGTLQRVTPDKTKYIDFVNGQKDIVYPDGSKIRTYPDGRVKKYNVNGKIEE